MAINSVNKEKSKKNKPKKKWTSYSSEDYQLAAEQMVHYSAKGVNSNAKGFGIRLKSDNILELPYVAAITMDRTNIPLDYPYFNSDDSSIKQIHAVMNDKFENLELPTVIDNEAIKSCQSVLDSASSLQPEMLVDIRLRQIILQNEFGEDVAATPLPCAGLSVLINKRIDEKEKKYFFSRAFLPVGGSKSHNVGLNCYAMKRPLLFNVPTMNEMSLKMRKAYGLYYKGMRIKPNLKIIKEFIKWQKSFKSFNAKNATIHQKENEFLQGIATDFIKKANANEQLLLSVIDQLPEQQPYSSTLPELQQGLLNSELRTFQWRWMLAYRLHSEIVGTLVPLTLKNDSQQDIQKKVGLRETHEGSTHWILIIEEALK